MEHKKYDGEFNVGSKCAENMDVNASAREENYKIRKTAKKWMPLIPGNYDHIRLKKKNSYYISVWKEKEGVHSGQYSYNVSGPSNRWFPTIEDAQQAAIDEKWPLFLNID